MQPQSPTDHRRGDKSLADQRPLEIETCKPGEPDSVRGLVLPAREDSSLLIRRCSLICPVVFRQAAGIQGRRKLDTETWRRCWHLMRGGGLEGRGVGGLQVRGGLMVKQRGAHIPWVFAVCAQWSWQLSTGQRDPLCLHRSQPAHRLIWLALNSFVGTLSAAPGWKIQLT